MTPLQTCLIVMQPKIEYNKCLQDGAIGGVGAIPGTFCAHFCDVIKIRQQLTGERLKHAVTSIYQGGGNGRSIRHSTTHFFAGALLAIQQKVATRSTMFLASSISVQFFEHDLGFGTTSAAFVGSATSGYVTGFIAAPWEWQKVLVSMKVDSPSTGKGSGMLLAEAKKHHGVSKGLLCVGRRMHGAGLRNAIFDSTFFGTKRVLEDWNIMSSGIAYGIAAVIAVTFDYAVDVSVKRTYAIGPEQSIPVMSVAWHTLNIVSNEGRKIFRGVGVKSVEFGISYMITGMMAPYIASAFGSIVFNEENALR